MLSIDDFAEFINGTLNRYVLDNFQCTETLDELCVGTGAVTRKLHEILLETGSTQNSSALLNYNNPFFNPHYSQAFFRLTIPDVTNLEAFIGFKETLAAPTFTSTESHAGIYIINGKLYNSCGRTLTSGANYKNVEVMGIDLARDNIFQIQCDRLSSCPLPQLIPYYDSFRIKSFGREWSLRCSNSTYPPLDNLHYFVFWIKNTGNLQRTLSLKNFSYFEEYAD
jgi:hypothetical protein